MKKSELRQLIREEIKRLTEAALFKVLTADRDPVDVFTDEKAAKKEAQRIANYTKNDAIIQVWKDGRGSGSPDDTYKVDKNGSVSSITGFGRGDYDSWGRY